MSKPVVILGGGGHSHVVIDILRVTASYIYGIVDPKSDIVLPAGVPHLGADLQQLDPANYDLVIGIGSIDVGERNPRRHLFLEAKHAGFYFRTLKHPSAIIAGDVEIGEGAQIMAGVVIQPGAIIGRNVIVNTSASIDHHCHIEDHVHIAPGAVLSGSVRVGLGSHIGTGAIVIQGVVIEAEAMVGAGAVVTKLVPSGARLRPAR